MQNTYEKIISGDYCSGCGACVGVLNSKKNTSAQMIFNDYGQYTPYVDKKDAHQLHREVADICPFSSYSFNEDYISKLKFNNNHLHEKVIGYYHNIYAGAVTCKEQRLTSSGGGLLTAVLEYLFLNDIIDYVVHTGPIYNNGKLFEYGISENIDQIKSKKGSHYYPVSMDEVLKKITVRKGRYVFVGIPCFVKAFENLIIKKELPKPIYTFGIVCGHLKTKDFAEMVIKRVARRKKVKSISFRITDENARANEYRMGVTTKSNEIISKSVQLIPGSNWGESAFKLNACDFCDDVYNECADITFGDAWLPKYIKDGLGMNVVVVRNDKLNKILNELKESQQIMLEELTSEEALKAQDATIRHRINGLPFRINMMINEGKWVPSKRIFGFVDQSARAKKINELRMILSKKSKYLFFKYKGNLLLYDIHMWGFRRRYLKLYMPKKYCFLPVEVYRQFQILKSYLLRIMNWIQSKI